MASKYTEQNADKVKEAHSTLYNAGLEMRYKVAGKEYVDRALENATSEFAKPMQEVRITFAMFCSASNHKIRSQANV